MDSNFLEKMDNEGETITSISLTKKQLEVLLWASQGKTNWEISIILRRTEATIVYHMKESIRRLQANNKTHAVSKAIRLGFLRKAGCEDFSANGTHFSSNN
jgi:DNA-binding CsgD family transcriptional regulator